MEKEINDTIERWRINLVNNMAMVGHDAEKMANEVLNPTEQGKVDFESFWRSSKSQLIDDLLYIFDKYQKRGRK